MPSLKAQGSFWELQWKDCERQRSLPTSCFPGRTGQPLLYTHCSWVIRHEIKPAKILAGVGEGHRMGDSFLQGCCPWEAACALAGASTPVRMQAALSGLGGFRKGAHEVERKE